MNKKRIKLKIVLWGMGKEYNSKVNILKYYEAKGDIQIVALTSNELLPFKYLDNWEIINKEELNEIYFDLLIVMSEINYRSILKDIVSLGISKEKIVPCRVLDIPYFNFIDYFELRQNKISILSNNCWGGLVYHTLGMECLSPFKNLALECKDYIHMLNNLTYYMEIVPEFVRYQVDPHSKESFPVMRVDDVNILFNHDKTPEEAVKKWERRKKKINYDNLFVEMYTEDIEEMEEYMKLYKYEKKVCFVPHKNGISYEKAGVYDLEMAYQQREFYETVNGNATNGKNAFTYNIINLLNMEKIYRYKY